MDLDAPAAVIDTARSTGTHSALFDELAARGWRKLPRRLAPVENALLRAALGDYSDEAAILLLITSDNWLPQLQHTGLITLDGNVHGEGLWAHIAWPDLDAAVRIGTITGSSERWVPGRRLPRSVVLHHQRRRRWCNHGPHDRGAFAGQGFRLPAEVVDNEAPGTP